MLLLLLFLIPLATGDVIRTVFCRRQCNEYLEVPETAMRACRPEHLRATECGTVITCDWSEAEKDKVRPLANATDLCCYRTVIKEKGDCDVQDVEVKAVPQAIQPTNPSPQIYPYIGWMMATLFAVIAVAEAGYIIWTCIGRSTVQKVYLDEPQRPLFTARPIIDTRLA